MSSNTTLEEVLISAVQKCPCLWNKEDKNYYSKAMKEAEWLGVLAEVVKAVPYSYSRGLKGREQQQKYSDII